MPKVVVDEEKCVGCGTCVQVCPMGVYELVDNKAKPVNEDQCVACRACEAQCPVQAITIEE
ncbi:MAG: ferredoxin [Candidatus Methanomethylicota archaeon]|uniref:Ferredoxin n=1 Tax=Thermoproteota archaeon TaxID=2056631 RepID=A0A497F1Y9_9CREN|nr:MAG: ferredoxin [Candidatus Verstraetearchaeota archaeon]RLE53505.1 MAG: ferredoxin [Candidatus Verstraetearchaeota archaeon]